MKGKAAGTTRANGSHATKHIPLESWGGPRGEEVEREHRRARRTSSTDKRHSESPCCSSSYGNGAGGQVGPARQGTEIRRGTRRKVRQAAVCSDLRERTGWSGVNATRRQQEQGKPKTVHRQRHTAQNIL